MPDALLKFWPRSWLVAPCSDLPSCISASMQYVRMAPANRSLSVLRPVSTGIAIHSSAKVR